MTTTGGAATAPALGAATVLVLLAGCADAADPVTQGTGSVVVTETERATTTETEVSTETATGTVTDTVTATDTATTVVTQTETVDADEPADDEGIDANTEPDTASSSGEPPVLVDVRVGSHAGFDRVVWEFSDGGTPGWRAEYVDDPARQGSGAAVELLGEATLQVLVDGVRIPTDAPTGVEAYEGSDRLAAESFEVITRVVPGSWFEGQLDGFVGVESEQPFRVRLLKDPTRVVLDVEQQ